MRYSNATVGQRATEAATQGVEHAAMKPPRQHRALGVPQAPAGVSGAFDVWLDRSLKALCDSVAAEPLPDELLKLIADDQAKSTAQQPVSSAPPAERRDKPSSSD